jgi:aspartate-semialdehyde dehydrogenase
MKPIIDAFGINMCFQVTLQSMSGAGPKGLASMDMVENMIPFIGKEEEKLEKEGPRILGAVGDGEIIPNPMPLSTSCNRISVLYGHTMCIFAQTDKPASVDEAKTVFAEWTGPPQELQLGRIRVDPAFSQGIKWVVMGDNFVRGTAGNTILNAELLYAKDLL